MAFTVPATQALGNVGLTIVNVVNMMAGVHPPANIAFPFLGNPPNTNNLGTGQGQAIAAGPMQEVTRAIGLLTCASVCYFNAAPGNLGYVYHANAGHVGQASFLAAMAAIQAGPAPYNTVYIAYAHNGPTDPGYQQTIADFVTWGVPTGQIVEITHLFLPQFGMNNVMQIGY